MKRASSYQERTRENNSSSANGDEEADGIIREPNRNESDSGSDSTSFDIESENELRANVTRTISGTN